LTSERGQAETYRLEVEPHGCFVCGDLNADGLRLPIYSSADRAWTELTIEPRFQGWADLSHGGILATLLDEVMGWALFEHDCWGVTAEMTVRYKRPVPVGQRIRVEGWPREVRRRLFRAEGHIVDAAAGTVLCTASGTYVAPDAASKAALKQRYRLRLVPTSAPTRPSAAVPPANAS
jgi:uncharacterized protein (TIGR00369 family)